MSQIPPAGPPPADRRPTPPARVSAAGRVTLPKYVRDALGIDAGGDVEFEVTGADEVVLRRRSAAAHPLRGLLHAYALSPAPSTADLDAGIGQAVGDLDAATRAAVAPRA